MKIFPLTPQSKLDLFINLIESIPIKSIKNIASKPDEVIINNTVKTLKKGRSICDKLSE